MYPDTVSFPLIPYLRHFVKGEQLLAALLE